eukprot:COSAG06_NODE_106_length_23773_cov_20.279083_18_plen_215_part_00
MRGVRRDLRPPAVEELTGPNVVDDHYETPTEAATHARPDPRLTAGATDAATSDAVTSDEVANKVMDGAKALGEKVGMLGKAAGLAGGLFAAGDDAIHGFKLQGDNAYERTGNALTIAGTVADFIPGLELVGMGLNAWAAVDEFKGDRQSIAANDADAEVVLLLVAMDGMWLMTGPEQAKVVEEQAKKLRHEAQGLMSWAYQLKASSSLCNGGRE